MSGPDEATAFVVRGVRRDEREPAGAVVAAAYSLELNLTEPG